MISFKNKIVITNLVRILCFLAALAGFIFDAMACYPGFLSPDSISQYEQAVSHHYYDWHPPIMSALWGMLLPIYNGPQPMFFLQLFLLWTGFYVLLLVALRNYGYKGLLVILFILAPFVQNFVGNIWKDVHLAISWFFASMIMINAFYQQRKMTKIEAFISLLTLSYGCWIRINALPGVVPLAALWIFTLYYPALKNFKQIFIFSAKAFLVAFLMLAAQIALTKLVLKPEKSFNEYKLLAHDLTGIYVKTGDLVFPEFIKKHPGFDTVYLKNKYRYNSFDNIWWNGDGKTILPNVNEYQMAEMTDVWLKAVQKYPDIYFENKLHGFLNFLRLTNSGVPLYTFYPMIHSNEYGFNYKPNKVGDFYYDEINPKNKALYMKPWFWALLNLVLLRLAFTAQLKRIKAPLLALTLSSFFYLAFQFFIFSADSEFRYFYWNCVAVALASTFAIFEYTELLFRTLRSLFKKKDPQPLVTPEA